MLRASATATIAAGAAYVVATAGAAVWGLVTLTRTRRSRFDPSTRFRRMLGVGSPSPTRGDEPLWHPAVVLTGRPSDTAGAVVELAGAAVDVPGRWGLEWHDRDGAVGYAQLGDVRAIRADDAVPGGRIAQRPIRVLRGDIASLVTSRPAPARAALCAYVWPDDPDILRRELARAGVPTSIRRVGVASTGGLYPATVIEPARHARARGGDTWVIAIHGRGSRPAQIYRMVALLARRGVTTMAITYRGDPGTPLNDGRSTLGALEWQEVESAVGYALSCGARRVVLYAFSMGAAIGTAFLRRSPLGDAVTAVVLDAPVLDWGPVLQRVARRLRLPRPAVPVTMSLARWLTGADFALVNRLLPPSPSSLGGGCRPTLLIHGTDDPVVPVCSSDMLAAAEPDAVRYLRVEAAGHTTAYNYAPARYGAHVWAFLSDVVIGPTAPAPVLVARPDEAG